MRRRRAAKRGSCCRGNSASDNAANDGAANDSAASQTEIGSGREVDPIAPAIQTVGNGVEGDRDPLLALVSGHFVIEVAGKQHEISRFGLGQYVLAGVERSHRGTSRVMAKRKIGTTKRPHEHRLAGGVRRS